MSTYRVSVRKQDLGVSHEIRSRKKARLYARLARERGFLVQFDRLGTSSPIDPERREAAKQLAGLAGAGVFTAVAMKTGIASGLLSGPGSLLASPATAPSGSGPAGGSSWQVPVTTSDPQGAPPGSFWYREDLGLFRGMSGILGLVSFAPLDPGAGGSLWASPISQVLTSKTILYAGLSRTAILGTDSSTRLVLDPTNTLGVKTSHNVLDDKSGNATFSGTVTASSYYGELDTATLAGYPFSLTLSSGYVLGWNGSDWIMYAPGSGAVASINGQTGAITITGGTGISVGTLSGTITITNTGVTSAVAGNGIAVSAATGSVTFSAVLNGSTLLLGASGLSLNLGNANTWTAVQTFGNNISIGGVQFSVSGAAKGDLLYNNGSNWVNLAIGSAGYALVVSGGVPSWTALSGVSVVSLNGLTGALSLTSPLSTLSIGTSGSNVTVDLAQTDLSDSLITSTSQTTVATYTPSVQRNVLLWIYFRIVTGATSVLIQVTYTDGSGSETYTPVNLTLGIGSFIVAPMNINATAAVVSIVVTVGNANYVYMSAKIRP